MEAQQIDNWFSYHAPTPEQLEKYNDLRQGARAFAHLINSLVPESADKTAAMWLLRESVMTANAAIACGGK